MLMYFTSPYFIDIPFLYRIYKSQSQLLSSLFSVSLRSHFWEAENGRLIMNPEIFWTLGSLKA